MPCQCQLTDRQTDRQYGVTIMYNWGVINRQLSSSCLHTTQQQIYCNKKLIKLFTAECFYMFKHFHLTFDCSVNRASTPIYAMPSYGGIIWYIWVTLRTKYIWCPIEIPERTSEIYPINHYRIILFGNLTSFVPRRVLLIICSFDVTKQQRMIIIIIYCYSTKSCESKKLILKLMKNWFFPSPGISNAIRSFFLWWESLVKRKN